MRITLPAAPPRLARCKLAHFDHVDELPQCAQQACDSGHFTDTGRPLTETERTSGELSAETARALETGKAVQHADRRGERAVKSDFPAETLQLYPGDDKLDAGPG